MQDKQGPEIQPTMRGIFFEDINFAADGGLYAELVKNRSFEFATPLMGWKQTKIDASDGSVLIENRGSSQSANKRFATVSLTKGSLLLANEGFRGKL